MTRHYTVRGEQAADRCRQARCITRPGCIRMGLYGT